MRALGALYLISSLFARETKGAGALGAIAEDMIRIVCVAALGLSRGVKGKETLQRAQDLKINTVFAAALVYFLGHHAERSKGKQAYDRRKKTYADDVSCHYVGNSNRRYNVSNDKHE